MTIKTTDTTCQPFTGHGHRPYRAALGVNAALEEITLNRGMLFDERVVDACLAVFAKGEFHRL
jgi:hypothetical protein